MSLRGLFGRHRRASDLFNIPALFLALAALSLNACTGSNSDRVLIFTAAEDFRHGSTAAGIEALRTIGEESNFIVEVADSSDAISEANLANYRAVVFLNTSGDVLDFNQQAEFERFVQAGGGFVGIHSAAETEADWDWYGRLVGARYDTPVSEYPRMTPAMVTASADHPPTDSLESSWNHVDEWYHFGAVSPDVQVLLRMKGENATGSDQPVAWVHTYDGGRAFYTSPGHNPEAFRHSGFRSHLKAGIEYVLGDREQLDYSRVTTPRMPEEHRFEREILADSLDEPTELVLLGDGNVIFTERKGALKLYDAATESIRTIAQIDVHTEFEDGLMGIALDPGFRENNWIYLYYSPVGDEPKQHLSRFILQNDSLLMDTEIVVLEVPTQRDECCHTAGSVEFGPEGNLFLSTGDDTNPFESDGFGPIDERPGRSAFDAQGTSANTNDLRGKILRITPQDDGTYAIPEGNLFEPGTPDTREEIYVMGNRNPYRISIDQKTGILYWGEVGPDAGENDSLRGPRGYDEVNQARRAGFFGWPYFVGDNQAYVDFDFVSQTSGETFDPESPMNDSPNNSGIRELPPAQPAYIWYPYAESPEFPIVGAGGRNAMAGPVYHSDAFVAADGTFPDYFDGKLFIYDWIRGWVMIASMNDDFDLMSLEPFMPSVDWGNAIDMAFDEHGVLYVLEYGTGWFQRNADARLNRVVYNTGNRRPVAALSADSTVGAAPLTVRFSAVGSADQDGDDLNYAWTVGSEVAAQAGEEEFVHTFDEPGIYRVVLTVTDQAGASSEDELEVRVGNAPPKIDFEITGNRSFYWDERSFDYSIQVFDPEIGRVDTSSVDAAAVYVAFDYFDSEIDTDMLIEGHQMEQGDGAFSTGRQLIDESDCEACHSTTARSIGPSYVDVALRYREQPDAVGLLAAKIIQGGGGVWGEQAMAAHPQLTRAEASAMVEYILSLADEEALKDALPLSGRFATAEHVADTSAGTYVLRARYTDSGSEDAAPATGQALLALRHPRVEAEGFDESHHLGIRREAGGDTSLITNIYDGSYLVFRELDLTDIEQIRYRIVTDPLHSSGGRIELRLDSTGGALVSTVEIREASMPFAAGEVAVDVEPTAGEHDLYFVFKNDRGMTPEALFLLDWIEFVPQPRTESGQSTAS